MYTTYQRNLLWNYLEWETLSDCLAEHLHRMQCLRTAKCIIYKDDVTHIKKTRGKTMLSNSGAIRQQQILVSTVIFKMMKYYFIVIMSVMQH